MIFTSFTVGSGDTTVAVETISAAPPTSSTADSAEGLVAHDNMTDLEKAMREAGMMD